ncbi:REP element-mobilizing transposase RayT [Lysinibacillus composti]|uniref:Transposase n=1 Tax=Lysinibacillus composti TaxID=720633 RepID=A0A3N9U9L6_9BACI|nr:transposase [Lysinibacillus composti]MBM7610048.1 REP element-mobilizing transposase RayT [Lysinibacillus composti]RQW73309.1 transposase [Lysinibacillus composti]
MPREARKQSSTGIYHVIMRGINKQTIFEDEEDKGRFLEILNKYKLAGKYRVFGYCLMDNHIHLLLREADEALSTAIKRICSSYVYWYNMKYERCGHLFQERFKSENVETAAYFLTVLRYIHQNPLRAGLVKNVFESKWTSVNEYIHKSDIVDIDIGLKLFSPNRKKARSFYIEHMKIWTDDQCLDVDLIAKKTDQEVREYLYKLGVVNISHLQQLDKPTRNKILAAVKSLEGVSIRQLSRITGISKSVIGRL